MRWPCAVLSRTLETVMLIDGCSQGQRQIFAPSVWIRILTFPHSKRGLHSRLAGLCLLPALDGKPKPPGPGGTFVEVRSHQGRCIPPVIQQQNPPPYQRKPGVQFPAGGFFLLRLSRLEVESQQLERAASDVEIRAIWFRQSPKARPALHVAGLAFFVS